MANAIRVLSGGGGSAVEPVQLPEGADLAALTHEQYMQIYNNACAGCCVILIGDKPLTIIAMGNGGLSYLTDGEPLTLTPILEEGED